MKTDEMKRHSLDKVTIREVIKDLMDQVAPRKFQILQDFTITLTTKGWEALQAYLHAHNDKFRARSAVRGEERKGQGLAGEKKVVGFLIAVNMVHPGNTGTSAEAFLKTVINVYIEPFTWLALIKGKVWEAFIREFHNNMKSAAESEMTEIKALSNSNKNKTMRADEFRVVIAATGDGA
jgi:hypothetical protein